MVSDMSRPRFRRYWAVSYATFAASRIRATHKIIIQSERPLLATHPEAEITKLKDEGGPTWRTRRSMYETGGMRRVSAFTRSPTSGRLVVHAEFAVDLETGAVGSPEWFGYRPPRHRTPAGRVAGT